MSLFARHSTVTMKFVPLFTMLIASAVVPVQAHQNPSPSKASQEYHRYRQQITSPAFGLKKVQKLIRAIKPDPDDNRRLSDSAFKAMSIAEKFTYTMIHGEDSSQNCDESSPILDEHKKVFSYLPGAFNNETDWSDRQRKFLSANRPALLPLLRKTMASQHRVGANLKSCIVELNAWELIPDLISVYKGARKDHDILTTLMLLMKENKFKPFLDSATFRKFYNDDASYQAYVDTNKANQNLTIERAEAFFRSQKKR